MPIPIGQEYMEAPAALGKIANYQSVEANTTACGAEEIVFGKAVYAEEDVAQVMTTGKDFFGVVLARSYVKEITAGDKAGVYVKGDAVPVIRKGTIWVQVDEDVISNQKAVVNTATGNFLPANTALESKTEVVGTFMSTAMADGLAMLQINLP
ncbi:hypothetical protein [Desemzia sp. FAM 23990]|uniref:structural cement protein Gp24 n=1 Tax=Desemzia sp. FAM 23990 TaxID=3259520 RepID=UPI00388A5566